VKSYGEDRIVVQNPVTSLLPSHWTSTDMQMLEAIPFGSESTELRSPASELRWYATRSADAAAHGKVTVMLPYFNKLAADQSREPALFSYAVARLHGFLWADALSLADLPGNQDFANALYQARLGKPTSEPQAAQGVWYREFARGVVLWNPNAWDVSRPADEARGRCRALCRAAA